MRKHLIALVFTLILTLALSASAQADMDAATKLVDAYVSHYNDVAARVNQHIWPIEPSTKNVDGVFRIYLGDLDSDSPKSFHFRIDDDTSGIDQLMIIIHNLSLPLPNQNSSLQDIGDLRDFLESTYATTMCFCALTLPGITDDVVEQFGEKLTEAFGAHISDDVSPLRSYTTDPISCDGLSISFATDGNGNSFFITFEFNPSLTHEPLI